MTITASEISSNGVKARSAWITIGCIRTGSSYLKRGEIGNLPPMRVPGGYVLSEVREDSGQPLSRRRVLVSERGAVLHFRAVRRPSRGESGLIDPWSKHLQPAVDAVPHLPPQVAIRSGGG